MNTSVATGVLSVLHESVELALSAVANANDNLTALPGIFATSDADNDGKGHSNRDTDWWGVSEASVRRYRVVSAFVELDNEDGFDLLDVVRVVNKAGKVKGVGLNGALTVANDSETVREAVTGVWALINDVQAETEAPAETEAVDETETEETEAVEVDKVLRWLQAPAGSLRKVLEAVQGGHIFTAEQRSAFDEILSIATSIAGAQAFVPAPVAVNA